MHERRDFHGGPERREIKEKGRGEGTRKERENKRRRVTVQQSEEQVQRFRKAQQRGPLMAEAPLTVPVCSAQIPRAGRLCEATEDCQHPPSPASQPPSHGAANKPAAACFFARAAATKGSAGDFETAAIATATEKRDCRSFQRGPRLIRRFAEERCSCFSAQSIRIVD